MKETLISWNRIYIPGCFFCSRNGNEHKRRDEPFMQHRHIANCPYCFHSLSSTLQNPETEHWDRKKPIPSSQITLSCWLNNLYGSFVSFCKSPESVMPEDAETRDVIYFTPDALKTSSSWLQIHAHALSIYLSRTHQVTMMDIPLLNEEWGAWKAI